MVVSIEVNWCNIKMSQGSQLRNTSYCVKHSECYKVPSCQASTVWLLWWSGGPWSQHLTPVFVVFSGWESLTLPGWRLTISNNQWSISSSQWCTSRRSHSTACLDTGVPHTLISPLNGQRYDTLDKAPRPFRCSPCRWCNQSYLSDVEHWLFVL